MNTRTDIETASRQAYWEKGLSYDAFLRDAEEYVELWTRNYERAQVPGDVVQRVEAVPGRWRLLVISEDWCIDATATVPVLAALADATSNLDLRVLSRDENLVLMDEHLTNGTARAIPVVIVLDGAGVERGWWGARPADLQAWFYGEAQTLDKDERYRQLRTWYARDKGQTTLDEVVRLVEQAGGAGVVA